MLIGIILILLGVYFIVKMLCPGFDIDINWNIIWPVILMVLGIEGIIRSKKLDLFNAILTLIGVIYLLSGLKIIGNINGRLIFAIILIGAGISFILSSLGKKKVKKISKDKMINYNGIFGGVKEVVNAKDFKGANCYSIFGGFSGLVGVLGSEGFVGSVGLSIKLSFIFIDISFSNFSFSNSVLPSDATIPSIVISVFPMFALSFAFNFILKISLFVLSCLLITLNSLLSLLYFRLSQPSLVSKLLSSISSLFSKRLELLGMHFLFLYLHAKSYTILSVPCARYLPP